MRADNGYAESAQKVVQKTEYLYDIDPTELLNMNYVDAIEYKLACANLLVKELLKPHYSIRDDARLNKVFAAQKFNEGLLRELKEVMPTIKEEGEEEEEEESS